LRAFYFHQIFELSGGVYQACLVSLGAKSPLWKNVGVTIKMILVVDWTQLMELLLNPDDYEVSTKNKK